MKYENNNVPKEALQTFKLYKPGVIIAWLLILIPAFSYFMIIEIMAKEYFGVFFCSLALLFFILMAMIGIQGLSDIVIGENGISRAAFGKTWQVIQWDNIKYITVFDLRDRANNKMYRTLNIYPVVKPRFRFLINGKMVFGERMERPTEFIALLNKYIGKYDIKIESVMGGIKTTPARL